MFRPGMAAVMAAHAISKDLARDAEGRRSSSPVRAAHARPEATAVRRLTHGVVAAGRFFNLGRREVPEELREPRVATQAS